MIVYDIEIKKAIAGKNDELLDGIEYCGGWHDHSNMGISCICAYDYRQDRYRTFCDDNMAEFQALACDADLLVGFNNIGFDNKVIRANGLFDIKSNVSGSIDFDAKSYDILREIWVADGLSPEFHYPSHIGYGLDNVVQCNFGFGKTGHGAGRHHRPIADQASVIVEHGKSPHIGISAEIVLPDVGPHLRADPGPEADLFQSARGGVVHGCRAPAAQAALKEVHGGLHEPGGHGDVEGVAAAPQHVGAGFGSHRFRANDHPPRDPGRLRCGHVQGLPNSTV